MKFTLAASLALALAVPCAAQAQRAPYGAPISLEQAKVMISGAEAEAKKNSWLVSVAIVDSGCNLVALHRIDNANLGGIAVAEDKARSACLYRGNTKGSEDALAKGGLGVRLLALRGIVPLEGGLVIVKDGVTIGAIGVSGAQSDEDGKIAAAGLAALK
ncbi:heme-binding protein [Bosea sp. RAF48]|uniref:GlcG/HbpS family heme-binding protein n=1 Tax=Bosea sp. RAF48 TaxID=3237480 RepID=UPI003F9186E8